MIIEFYINYDITKNTIIFTVPIGDFWSYWLKYHCTGIFPLHTSVMFSPDVKVSSETSGHTSTSGKNIACFMNIKIS